MTDWEQCYVEGQTPWNKGLPSPPMKEWVLSNQPAGRALVPGCGLGHDLLMLVEHGVDALGLDISPTAMALAKETHPALADRFVLGDLFATPADWQGSFDFVFEHTCLCALPPDWRPRYEQAVYSLLKPGALLVGVWYINPDMDPGESGPPFGMPVPELDHLFGAPRWQVVQDYVPSTAYDGRTGRERLRVLRKAL